jgi:hypothetical protein
MAGEVSSMRTITPGAWARHQDELMPSFASHLLAKAVQSKGFQSTSFRATESPGPLTLQSRTEGAFCLPGDILTQALFNGWQAQSAAPGLLTVLRIQIRPLLCCAEHAESCTMPSCHHAGLPDLHEEKRHLPLHPFTSWMSGISFLQMY